MPPVQLPCTQCMGHGYRYLGFKGLIRDVFVVGKDGEYEREVCKQCAGTGQIIVEPK